MASENRKVTEQEKRMLENATRRLTPDLRQLLTEPPAEPYSHKEMALGLRRLNMFKKGM